MSLVPKIDRRIAHLDYLLKQREKTIKQQQEFIQEIIRDKQFLNKKIDKLILNAKSVK